MGKRTADAETTWEYLETRVDGSLLVHIARGKDHGDYALRIVGRPGPGHYLARVTKEAGAYSPPERGCYQVEVANGGGTCTCWGWLRWRNCKHLDCVGGLIDGGYLGEGETMPRLADGVVYLTAAEVLGVLERWAAGCESCRRVMGGGKGQEQYLDGFKTAVELVRMDVERLAGKDGGR